MTVKQIIMPANRAFNSSGMPVAEATASLYLSGTSTPALFYADSGLSVSIGSTITANAAGRFATLPYGDDSVAYRLVLKDSSGTTLDDIDPFYFGSQFFLLTKVGVTPQTFGAVANGTTDDYTAIQAWLDSGGLLSLPKGEYYCSQTLIIRKHVVIEGEGYGFDARLVNGSATVGYELQPGARIRFPVGVAGLDIQPQTTVTDVATAVAAGIGGDTQEGAYGSRISNLALIGAGTGAAATGVHCRTRVDLENVHAYKFQGKGFDISASSDVPDGNEYGTASHSTLKGCRAISNGSHGFHIRGRDANVINLESCFSQLNGGWGFLDDSELGNTYVACLAATNTLGSFSASSAVGVQSYVGCYVETGTGYNCDLNSACQVIGGFLAQCALTNNAANQKAQILASNAAQLNYLKFVQNEENLGALSAQASIYRHADQGLVLQGAPDGGGSFDYMVRNKSDQAVMAVVTGTAVARFFGPIQPFSSYIYYNGSTTNPGLAAGDSVVLSHATNGLMLSGWGSTYDTTLVNHNGTVALGVPAGTTNIIASGGLTSNSGTGGVGYSTGAGGTVTQITSRTTGVTLNKVCGQITLFSAAGSATWSTFTVTNSTVAATDTVEIVQASGANLYNVIVTAVAAGSFNVSVSAVSGTATEAPVFNFVVTKSVSA